MLGFAIFIYCLIVLVPVLLGWDWWRQAGRGRYPITLMLVTVSCLWLLLGWVWGSVLGPEYSNLHAYIAVGNCLGSLILGIIAGATPSQRSWRMIVAALLLAFLWFFLLSIMYAV